MFDVTKGFATWANRDRECCEDDNVGSGQKQFDVHCSKEMMRVIDESSHSNHVICFTQVRWINWKGLLGVHFTVPHTLKVTKYHVFHQNSPWQFDGKGIYNFCRMEVI